MVRVACLPHWGACRAGEVGFWAFGPQTQWGTPRALHAKALVCASHLPERDWPFLSVRTEGLLVSLVEQDPQGVTCSVGEPCPSTHPVTDWLGHCWGGEEAPGPHGCQLALVA